ncbi:MAG: hypothetical protein ACPGSM_14940 [Thiolinea sp.]
MSEQTHSFTRREFLKGTAYASTLSIGGLSGLASANSAIPTQNASNKSGSPATTSLLAVTVSNHSDKAIALDPRQPVSLEQVNGWVVVKINKAKPDSNVVTGQQMNLAAGQQCSFPVDAELAPMLAASATEIVITNEYSTQDNLVPVMPYTMAA